MTLDDDDDDDPSPPSPPITHLGQGVQLPVERPRCAGEHTP